MNNVIFTIITSILIFVVFIQYKVNDESQRVIRCQRNHIDNLYQRLHQDSR